jgi:WXG100 family type VII secretion target
MSNAPEFGQGEGTLSKASGLVTDAKADFVKIAGTLSGQISAVQGKWGGQGAAAFFTLHTAWDEKQRVIVDALDEFAASLTTTEKDNVSTDDAQNASYTNLSNRLG